VREALRQLQQTREELQIQQQAADLAEQRIHSTDMFLQAGRAQIRDVLEAREARVNARNALIRAAVNYRVAQLRYQRDTELLQMTIDGDMIEQGISLEEDKAHADAKQASSSKEN
jgi:outer membrane protein TolC